MKRFIVITGIFSVSILALWAFFQPSLTSSTKAKSDHLPNQIHTSKDDAVVPVPSREDAIPVTGAAVQIAPVFDTTGAVVSDPTGTMLSANHSGDMAIPVTAGAAVKVAPVYDATGRLVSDPTGTVSTMNNP